MNDEKLIPGPQYAEYFYVYPKTINRKAFEKSKKDLAQERTRRIIVEAFKAMDDNPQYYGHNYTTFRPYKAWNVINELTLIEKAHNFGDYIASWIDQALEWAQRIDNGESWAWVCNVPDDSYWYRMVMWKDGVTRLIGGSRNANDMSPSTHIIGPDRSDYYDLIKNYTIPLVVRYIA